jgi:hypothetical protein
VGNNISIEKGLESGEQVVVDGADKLTDGVKVDARTMPETSKGRGTHS